MNYSIIVCVYKICHPITHDIAYVGCSFNYENRKYSHCLAKSKTDISFWINLLKDIGLLPVFEVLEYCNWLDMHEKERKWIDFYKSKGVKLLNMRQGRVKGSKIKKDGLTFNDK